MFVVNIQSVDHDLSCIGGYSYALKFNCGLVVWFFCKTNAILCTTEKLLIVITIILLQPWFFFLIQYHTGNNNVYAWLMLEFILWYTSLYIKYLDTHMRYRKKNWLTGIYINYSSGGLHNFHCLYTSASVGQWWLFNCTTT